MAADDESPPRTYRLPSLKGFLPLAADGGGPGSESAGGSMLSTRGQALPGLIQSLSSSNLSHLHHQAGARAVSRRPSSIRGASEGAPVTRARGPWASEGEHGDLEAGLEFGNGDVGGAESEGGGIGGRQASALGLGAAWGGGDRDDRRISMGAQVLMTPQMRSQRLIGNSNPRYKWAQYFKTDEELSRMKKPIRKYYERNNFLIQQYIYIDRLLDSSIPHSLIQEYNQPQQGIDVPPTIAEESSNSSPSSPELNGAELFNTSTKSVDKTSSANSNNTPPVKVKRTPRNLYKVPDEQSPLLGQVEGDEQDGGEEEDLTKIPQYDPDDETDSQDNIVKVAIYINLAANSILLVLKIIVTVLTSSISVLASLVDAALDFLSTAIVWTTTRMISRRDQYAYPVGRRRLEPIGVLVFSIIMITSFVQVAIEGFSRLTSGDETLVELTIPAVAIMASTVVVKFLCWLWCRFIKNSSVQALAQDAMTDVVFNIFSIIFPLIGYYANVWWFDPVGGIALSFYVIANWSRTSLTHIRNLSGAAASADERNVLLYLTMRFAKTIRQIQGLQAYHVGDKLNVEVDIVLDEGTSLRDSHDLGESLQYVLESVPMVDRAFVHQDYASWNLPSHMRQEEE